MLVLFFSPFFVFISWDFFFFFLLWMLSLFVGGYLMIKVKLLPISPSTSLSINISQSTVSACINERGVDKKRCWWLHWWICIISVIDLGRKGGDAMLSAWREPGRAPSVSPASPPKTFPLSCSDKLAYRRRCSLFLLHWLVCFFFWRVDLHLPAHASPLSLLALILTIFFSFFCCSTCIIWCKWHCGSDL